MKFKTIASRIIFSIIPIIALSTVVFICLSYYFSDRQINSAINERMSESLDAASLRMEMELQKNADVARAMASSTEVFDTEKITFARLNNYIEQSLVKSITSNKNTVGGGIWFEPGKIDNRKFYGPYVYVEEDKPILVTDYSEGGANDFHLADWYLNGKNANFPAIIWSGVYYDPVAKVIMVTATKPMYDKMGKFMGVTTADMALTDIKNITDALSVGKTGKAILLGSEGEIISFYKYPKEQEAKISDNGDPAWVKAGRYLGLYRAGIYKFKEDGVKKRIYFKTIPNVEWTLGIVIDESEIGSKTLFMLLLITIVPVLGLILSVFSIIAVARHLRFIANKVNTFANRAAMGDFNKRIDVTETDEFGYMEERLNIMMENMESMTEHNKEMLAIATAASQAKGDFLSRMSHEIRTPMNAIIGMTQIANKTQDIDKIREAIGKIENASKLLLALINDILDMSKIEAGKLELVKEDFCLEDIIGNISNVISVKTEEKDQKLNLSIDPSLPEFLRGDELRLSQVVTNLLSNAVKFTPDNGTITLEVKNIETTSQNCTLQINVKDTGIGLSDSEKEKLFQPFEQADGSTSRKFGGTGLGLAISKRIVEMMGGKIWVDSVPGEGSTFSFTASFEIGSNPDATAQDLSQTQLLNSDFSKNYILLVEDIDINREIVTSLLEDTAIHIDYAENGQEAVNMFAAAPGKYDLIFMDLQMPVMDGLEATRTIRAMSVEQSKTVPIIAMTANAFKEDVERGKDAGMTDHISKPIDYEIMMSKLRFYLPRR